ncbi:AI-2E family transporter [Arthrobacter halodurans]|uniref:AI-2E family transporter n=1 Tax=Arthrobacter halodurans TaxID=516699 RepID=A0ABV4UK16_9MICC
MSEHSTDQAGPAEALAGPAKALGTTGAESLPAPGAEARAPRPVPAVSRSDAPRRHPPSPRRGTRPPVAQGFTVALGVLLAIALAGSLILLRGVAFDVFAGLFIALAINPLIRLLVRAGFSRGQAVLAVALGFAVVAVVALTLIVPAALRQAEQLVRGLPAGLANLADQPWVEDLNAVTSGGVDAALQSLSDAAGQPTLWAALAGGAINFGVGLIGLVSSGVFIAVLTLYFLVSLRGMKRGFYSLIGASRRRTAIYLTEKITDSVGRYLGGMVILALCNSIFSLVLLTLTRVPFAGAISLAAFFITLIPLIGTVLTTCVMTLFALLSSPTAGLIVLLTMLVYMQVEAYVMTPKVMSKALHVPGALVLISATAGATLLGLPGALVAVPIAAACTLMVRYIVVPRQNTR